MLFGYILSSWGLVSNYNTQKIWIRTAERQLSSPAVGKSHTGTVRLTVSYPLVAGEQRLRGHTLRDSPTCLAAAGSRTWAFSVVSRVCYPLHYKVCVCVCVCVDFNIWFGKTCHRSVSLSGKMFLLILSGEFSLHCLI